MNNNKFLLIFMSIQVIIFTPFLVALGYDSVCDSFPSPSWHSSSLLKHKGQYINYSWGYSVVIPEGLVGISDPASHPQHGFGILLSREPYGYIWTDGSANSLDWKSINEAANGYIQLIEMDKAEILSVKKYDLKVNGYPFLRLVVKYKCPNGIMVRDYFITIDSRQIVYTIALSTVGSKYSLYKTILEKIANTFQLQGRK